MTSTVQGYALDCLAGDDVARAHVIFMGVAADRWGECLDYWVQRHPPDAGVGADWRDTRPPLIWRTPFDSGAPKSPSLREGMRILEGRKREGKREREGERRGRPSSSVADGGGRYLILSDARPKMLSDAAVGCKPIFFAHVLRVFYSRVVES